MIATAHLIPPTFGSNSDPVLYAVAQAIAAILPVEAAASALEAGATDAGRTRPEDGLAEPASRRETAGFTPR